MTSRADFVMRVLCLDPVERSTLFEARDVLSAPGIAVLRAAHRAGQCAEIRVGTRAIVYQPDLPPSHFGMSLFGEAGFVLGPAAFGRKADLLKTLLHELYRLQTGQGGSGASQPMVSRMTVDAWSFAERTWRLLRWVVRQRKTTCS